MDTPIPAAVENALRAIRLFDDVGFKSHRSVETQEELMSRGRCGSLEDDELLLFELNKRNATQFRQGVFRREREPQFNMHHRLERELACRFSFSFGDQCEINLIIQECFELHSGNHLEEVHVHHRKLLSEGADDPRQKQTSERTQKGNGEMSSFPRICGLS